jgi:hypothetical protein
MKVLPVTLALVLLTVMAAFGQPALPALPPAKLTATNRMVVTLAWDPSPTTNSGPITYKVYYGGRSGTYTNSVPAGTNLTASVTGLAAATTYYFVATATDTNKLESDYSTEVFTKTPTNVITTITTTIQVIANIQASGKSNGQYTNYSSIVVTNLVNPTNNLFFRSTIVQDNTTNYSVQVLACGKVNGNYTNYVKKPVATVPAGTKIYFRSTMSTITNVTRTLTYKASKPTYLRLPSKKVAPPVRLRSPKDAG